MTSLSAKQTVRGELLRRRASRPVEALAAAAESLAGHLAAWLRDRPSPLVAAYVPIGSEPGGPGLPEALTALGARVILPVVLPSMDLDWALYAGAGSLVLTGRRLQEPAGPLLGPSAVAGCDLVLVPALAADQHGNRLGRGAGCYDRALAMVPAGVPVVALLHDGELVGELPSEPHDIRVTAAITPGDGWCDLPRFAPPPLDDSRIIEHT